MLSVKCYSEDYSEFKCMVHATDSTLMCCELRLVSVVTCKFVMKSSQLLSIILFVAQLGLTFLTMSFLRPDKLVSTVKNEDTVGYSWSQEI